MSFKMYRVVFGVFLTSAALYPAYGSSCEPGTPLPLNGHVSLGGVSAGESLVVEVEVFERGELTVAVRGSGTVVPVLAGCHGKETLERTLNRSTLRVVPGTYAFRVAAQDLESPLHQVDVRTRFVPERTSVSLRRVFEGGQNIEGEEDPDEIEVEIDPFRAPTASIEGEEDPDEIEVEIDPFWEGENERSYRLVLAPGSHWVVRVAHKDAGIELLRDGLPIAARPSTLRRLLTAGTYELWIVGDGEPEVTAVRW